MICPHCHKDTELAPRAASLKDTAWLFSTFEEFWSLFPRKVAKASALKAWKKIVVDLRIKDEIMAGLNRQRPALVKQWLDKPSFVPHAATWLNGRRWEDEQAVTPSVTRHIACDKCGDSGMIYHEGSVYLKPWFQRCLCPRGQMPGLMIPQAEEIDSTPF